MIQSHLHCKRKVSENELYNLPSADCYLCALPGEVHYDVPMDRLFGAPGASSFKRRTEE